MGARPIYLRLRGFPYCGILGRTARRWQSSAGIRAAPDNPARQPAVTASAQVIGCFVSYDETTRTRTGWLSGPAPQPGPPARLDTYRVSRRAPGRGESAR